MVYTVEYLKFVAGRAEASVVDRLNGRFHSPKEAKRSAMVLFAAMQSVHAAVGFRVIEDGEREVEAVYPGRAVVDA